MRRRLKRWCDLKPSQLPSMMVALKSRRTSRYRRPFRCFHQPVAKELGRGGRKEFLSDTASQLRDPETSQNKGYYAPEPVLAQGTRGSAAGFILEEADEETVPYVTSSCGQGSGPTPPASVPDVPDYKQPSQANRRPNPFDGLDADFGTMGLGDPQGHQVPASSSHQHGKNHQARTSDPERSKSGPTKQRPTDIVVAVMGKTGSGKSTFISKLAATNYEYAIGHGLRSGVQVSYRVNFVALLTQDSRNTARPRGRMHH